MLHKRWVSLPHHAAGPCQYPSINNCDGCSLIMIIVLLTVSKLTKCSVNFLHTFMVLGVFRKKLFTSIYRSKFYTKWRHCWKIRKFHNIIKNILLRCKEFGSRMEMQWGWWLNIEECSKPIQPNKVSIACNNISFRSVSNMGHLKSTSIWPCRRPNS
jgi:hypothetical protein